MMPTVAFAETQSPIGPLALATTPSGLVRVLLSTQDFAYELDLLAKQLDATVTHDPDRLENALQQFDEYFNGKRLRFELPIDLSLTKGFRRETLEALTTVPFGSRISYQELATKTRSPNAIRAAASACATNPIPIVIPCHRIVHANGTIGKYLSGAQNKQWLLDMEQRISL